MRIFGVFASAFVKYYMKIVRHTRKLNNMEAVSENDGLHTKNNETSPCENQNLFTSLTMRTYVWIVPNWTLQQSMAIVTERQVQKIAYQCKL